MSASVHQTNEEKAVGWVDILFPGDNLWWISGALGVATAGTLLVLSIAVQMIFFRPHILHPAAPPSLPSAPCDLCDRRMIMHQ